MLDKLIRYAHGFVAVPVISAFKQRCAFEALRSGHHDPASLGTILRANSGHLAAALDLLTALGWIETTEAGRLQLLPRANPGAVPDGLLAVYRGARFPNDAPLSVLREFVPRMARGWDCDPELADYLCGVFAVPLLNSEARLRLRDGTAEGVLRDAFAALGWIEPSGRPSPLGAFAVERGPVTGTTASYAPLLRAMPDLLFGDPAAIMNRDDAGAERHIDRAVNVVSSGFQHGRYFADVERVLEHVLDAPDLAAQPDAIVDMGCGDGTLLRRVWDVVRRTRRGAHLATYPLSLVGVDFNAAALAATAPSLAGLPHLLLPGDIADPLRLASDLRAHGIDPARVLHVRSFLDHDRPAAPPRGDSSSRRCGPDTGVVVAPDGTLVPPAQVVQSLVEHLQAWRGVLGPHGLLLLEVHRLPARIVAQCRDEIENAHFDAYHAFSGQQLVAADVFLLAAAEAGLFGDSAAFLKYPRVHPFARIQLQHLRPRPWRLRAAVPADLPDLLRLEALCWPEPALRHDAATLQARLARPLGILLAEQDGTLAGALHVQRVASLDGLRTARFASLDRQHRPDGPVLHLLGLMVRPDAQATGLGDALAEFALQWAALTPGVHEVAGISRCRDWDGTGDYEAWVRQCGPDGLAADATLRFHVARGAQIVAVVPGFRPDDIANAGHGVLIRYPGRADRPAPAPADDRSGHLHAQVAACVRAVMRGGAARFDPGRPLRDLGLDSADLLELRTLLNRRLGIRVEASFFFDHPTVDRIADALPRRDPPAPAPKLRPAPDPAPARPSVGQERPARAGDIAVIGMACRFPGAPDIGAFWQLLEQGAEATGSVPPDRWPAPPEERGGFLADADQFDPAAFEISAREALGMDPQQRLLLETALAAIEHAGIDPDALRGTQAGVVLGLFAQDWERRMLQAGKTPDGHFATGTSNAIAAGRLAYVFGLRGPALTVNTACSSSLVAVHLAAQSLRRGETSLAIAGGASLLLMPDLSQAFGHAGMLAADGRCRPFDAAARGYGRSEGVGVVVLKRLESARASGDRVLAILRGSAINQDGASNGLTAPSGAAQQEVIATALADAGLGPADVDAVEAHGTGTPLGDPIEARALAEAYGVERSAPLLISACKGNIGHTEAAAGIAGLIKCVLALQTGRLPGIAHLVAPNPAIAPLLSGPIRLAHATTPLPAGAGRPNRMAVSSFGFSGTNAHAILEAAATLPAGASGPAVMPLSARTEPALRRLAASWAAALDGAADPLALCATASRRRVLPVRGAVIGRSVAELRTGLTELATRAPVRACVQAPRIGFLFTGQGSQYRGMGRALAATAPPFRTALDRADGVLRPLLGRSLDELLTADDLDQTGTAQPAICAIQLALVELLAQWGVRPAAILGHSVGEIAACFAAGVLTFEHALLLSVLRGRVMQALPAGGAMLALSASADAAEHLLAGFEPEAGLAAMNGPRATVVSGSELAMEAVAARAEAAGIAATRLRVSHAFHSPLMQPAQAPLATALRMVAFQPAQVPIHSTLYGAPADLSDPDYWVRQLCAPVRFATALQGLEADILLELGPRAILTGLARGCGAPPCEPVLMPDGDAAASALAALHCAGARLNWRAIHGTAHPGVDLPPTPLERRRFWVDLPAAPKLAASASVLGRRMALPGAEAARWEALLRAEMAPFFEDHRLHGSVVVPAASHVAVALTALARLDRPTALADLVFAQPLTLASGEVRRAQLVLDGDRVRLLTASAADELPAAWSDHLEARAVASAPQTRPPRLPASCDRIAGAAFYEDFAAAGYTFGPAMRGLRAVAIGGDLAAGELAAGGDSDLVIDPALFDAALQVQGVWFDTPSLRRDGALFVPFGAERVEFYAAPHGPVQVVAHRLQAEEPDASTRIADLWLLDASERVVMQIHRFRFRRVAASTLLATADDAGVAPWLHRLHWRAEPARCPPSASDLLDGIGAPEDAAAGDDLADVAAGWAAAAFAAAGRPLTLGEPMDEAAAMERLGAQPSRAALVGDLLHALRGVGAIDRTGRVCRLPLPPDPAPGGPAAALLAQTGPWLLAVARGLADPLALLFPDGDAAAVARLYHDAGCFAAMHRAVAAVCAKLAWPGLRVIEVGGGTGATTSALLDALPGCDYLFTDISASFCAEAGSRFPGLPTAVLDLERDAGPLDGRRFDLAVAANVLHAVQDLDAVLRRVAALLRPGGMLLLVEGSARRAWVDLTFGLLDGWRRHLSGPAPRTQTLLDADTWRRALAAAGFEPAALATPDAGPFPQTLLVARRTSPPRWRVLGRGSLADAVRALGVAPAETGPADAVLICAEPGDPAGSALNHLRNLLAKPPVPGPVWLVTQGAVSAAAGDAVPAPEQAGIWGLGRTARLEFPELDLRIVDLEHPSQLAAYLHAAGAEREVALRGADRLAAQLIQDAGPLAAPDWRPAPDHTYLVTGGFGGLGLRLAEALASRGAGRLVLAGRRLPADPAALSAIRRHGTPVETVAIDVTDEPALAALVARTRPAAVFHLAGLLDDAPLTLLDPTRLARVAAPKSGAAALLDRLLPGRELLVLFGSVAGLIGNPGQVAHAAASATLGAIAAARRARGQPGLCVDWGAWAEIGTVAANNPYRGLRPMPPAACLAALWRLIGAGLAHGCVMDVAWAELRGRTAAALSPDLAGPAPATGREAIAAHIVRLLRAILAIPAEQPVDPRQGFFAMGLDSLTSLELRGRLQASLGRPLPATITFDHPNVDALAAFLSGGNPVAADGPDDDPSDEAAIALIEREAARMGLTEAAL